LVEEVEETNLGVNILNERLRRWHTCSLCEQKYHGAVRCALGWACWKTYMGRPETDQVQCMAINQLGNGFYDAAHYMDALSVQLAEFSILRRNGVPEERILPVQSNLATTYLRLGRPEVLQMRRDMYSGHLKLRGEEDEHTLIAALNYASSLGGQRRYKELKSLLLKMVPVAQRVLGESHELTLQMRRTYACALIKDPGATLGDFRKAVTTLEETTRTARRVLGNSHPIVAETERTLQNARAALGAHGLTSG